MHRSAWTLCFLLAGWCGLCFVPAMAQQPPSPVGSGNPPKGGVEQTFELPALGRGILNQLGGGGNADEGNELTLSGEYSVFPGTTQGILSVRAEMAPTWHIYSMTQKPGGPLASRLTVAPQSGVRLTRPFTPSQPPQVKQEAFSVPSEYHEDEVIWSAPFEFPAGEDPTQLKFDVKYSGQVCSTACIPVTRQPVAVKYAGESKTRPLTTYQPRAVHAVLRGQISPRTVAPGGVVRLSVTVEPTAGYHVYAYAKRDPQLVSKPTLLVGKLPTGWVGGPVTASAAPVEHPTGIKEEPVQLYHEQPVTWSVECQVPTYATPGGYELAGLIGFQICSDTACDVPSAAEFRAVVEVSRQGVDEAPEPLQLAAYASYNSVAKQAAALAVNSAPSGTSVPADATPADAAAATGGAAAAAGPLNLEALQPTSTSAGQQSSWAILPTAFLAGFLLNFMPCVLPVIGLKLVSFVHQAGESRSRVFMLNLWYSLGVIAVFLLLATLAVFFGLGWGDQFRSATFNIVLACVVFAFALSFLGVWEIPLPGFVGSGAVNSVAEREGGVGAFFKGALSTVLATPCGGPLLGTALTWAVAQPPAVTYAGFACIGMGMASPYLLVGAFPRLIAFLPKPGDWMDTFKHVMGFVLLGTVVFILTFISQSLVVPTVATMIGLWAGLWWIGRVPVWDELPKRLRAWMWGTATAAAVAAVSFLWLADVMEARFQQSVDLVISQRMSDPGIAVAHSGTTGSGSELPWQLYSHARLQDALAQRKTVLVDFTADWCATCKLNESVALNVAETKDFVQTHGIVTLKADMTGDAPEADELKRRLGTKAGLPIYAVFPATAPTQPILFDGPITSSRVLTALKQALGSETATAAAPRQPRGNSVATNDAGDSAAARP
ncbi:MAG: cytochrome c biogenesis protein CcdA [Pirellulaceae bacterium]